MDFFKNEVGGNATASQIGTLYQYYLALKKCFEMKEENETVVIEILGDIAKISLNSKKIEVTEVKHHINEMNFSDRNPDLWKTLKNWVKDYEIYEGYETKFILSTTAIILNNSVFYDWNNKKSHEKYEILEKIGEEKKEKEVEFRKYFDKIFSYKKLKIEKILANFIIKDNEDSIRKIISSMKHLIIGISEENKEKCLENLYGIIVSKVFKPPHQWKISKLDFDKIFEDLMPKYVKGEFQLPLNYLRTEISKEIELEYNEKTFVSEIKKIQYDNEIPKAISDYWKATKTISIIYDSHLVYSEDIEKYSIDMEEKLTETKKLKKIDCEMEEKSKRIQWSKRFYTEAMTWDAENIGRIKENQRFFKNGIIHMIIDEKKVNWDIGEE